MVRYIGYGTVAAVALAVAGVLWSGGSATAHFQKALDNAEKAKSVTVTLSFELDGRPPEVRKFTRRGDVIREEPGPDADSLTVVDLTTGEGVVLNPRAKTAETMKIGVQERRMITGVIGDFTGIKATLGGGDEKAVKPAGEEAIGGRGTKAFEVTAKGPPAGIYKVWIDPKTDLPVRVKFTGEKGQASFTFDFTDWNKEHDAKLFRLELPAGYELVDAKK